MQKTTLRFVPFTSLVRHGKSIERNPDTAADDRPRQFVPATRNENYTRSLTSQSARRAELGTFRRVELRQNVLQRRDFRSTPDLDFGSLLYHRRLASSAGHRHGRLPRLDNTASQRCLQKPDV